ncbi:DUF3152 domain-containing protein [Streptomyces sp. N2-109]|uniref:DUF3152 domain-containing protein n=1 Tax=Streptomyces gossypii TaxID=2883101 RepID=A0ABT2JX45_9ACTN|nr:DUF3152 domain-containing protein [Streptomyces gossypii]MCT2591895.1 DUF3152 domain-containing protein [Streptomyces gossypii]
MGRHSRKRRDPAGTAPDAPAAPAAPPTGHEAPGGDGQGQQRGQRRTRPERGQEPPPSGRPQRTAPPGLGPDTPPHGASFFGGTASAAGLPTTRGGHPEHREPGGGWGASGAGHGAPVGAGEGPRQEYLDAFDDVFAAGAPDQRPGTGGSEQPGSSTPTGRAGPPPHPAQAAARNSQDHRIPAQRGAQPPPAEPRLPQQAPHAGDDGDDGPLAPLAPIAPLRGKARKGRTLTGAAAAAVTTVLAVVVAGQVAGGNGERDSRSARADAGRGGEADQASRSDGRPTPTASQKPAKPDGARSYDSRISEVHALPRDLEGPNAFTAIPDGAKGPGGEEVLRYRVDVEKELPLDGELFAEAVHTTLNDERSWVHDGARSFERVSSGKVDFVMTLASPGTTGVWCAKSGLDTTEQQVSCDSAATERIMINAYRWAQGSPTFGDSLMREYREMLINHEVGHRLGLDHVGCKEDGALAPVMMQQTKSLTSGTATCRPNAWPHPKG